MMSQCTKNGYTLIEILIALAIFSILSLLGGHLLIESSQTKQQLMSRLQQLEALEMTIALLRQDSEQIINRPIRLQLKALQPGFLGKKLAVTFTRDGLFIFDETLKKSSLQRVRWLCQKNNLIRQTWSILDDPTHTKPTEKILLSAISNCQFHYITPDHQQHSTWHPNPPALPKGIELKLTLPHFGKMFFLFVIPSGETHEF